MIFSFVRHITLRLPIRRADFSIPKPFVSRLLSTQAEKLEKPSLQIASSCIERLKKIAPNGTFLRVAIDGGGCSGFQYSFSLDSKINEDDICIEKDGAQVVVDNISLDFLRGATVEYHKELIRSSFRIVDNPQADSKCSCGTSFSVKDS